MLQPRILSPGSTREKSFRFQMPFLDLSFPRIVRCLSGGSCPSSATPGPAQPVPPWLTFIILSFCSLCRRRPGRACRRNPGKRETQSYSQAPVPGVRRAPARTGPAVTGAPDAPRPRPPGPLPGGPRWWPTCFMNSPARRGAEAPAGSGLPARPGLSPALSRPRARRLLPGRRPRGGGGDYWARGALAGRGAGQQAWTGRTDEKPTPMAAAAAATARDEAARRQRAQSRPGAPTGRHGRACAPSPGGTDLAPGSWYRAAGAGRAREVTWATSRRATGGRAGSGGWLAAGLLGCAPAGPSTSSLSPWRLVRIPEV